MLYCVNCGSLLEEESTLCLKCGFPVAFDEKGQPISQQSGRKRKESVEPLPFMHHVKLWVPLVLAIIGSAALYFFIQKKSDPSGIEIVKRHFVFYDDYSHGNWARQPCQEAGHDKCWDITYTVPVAACGPVTFSWRVFPAEDDLNYEGAMPRVDETKYAFYAFLVKDDGALIPSQALGKPVPSSCAYH
jgi:hypothetical protein